MLSKTLSQLGFKSARATNYANQKVCKPYVCCGWMELHSDIGAGASLINPFFYIKPIYWSRFAYLVVTGQDGLFHTCSKFDYLNKKKIDGIYYDKNSLGFNAVKLHGLVSEGVAESLMGKRGSEDGFFGDVYNDFYQRCYRDYIVKMIWEWDENENLT